MSIYHVENGIHKKLNTLYDVQSSINRKIQKGYYVTGGVHRKVYEGSSELVVTYTGTYTTSDVTVDDVAYTLWTLKGSGTLTVSEPVRYWMCGGGGKGGSATRPTSANTIANYDNYSGGGGGGGYVSTGTIPGGEHVVTVAARAGTSIYSI